MTTERQTQLSQKNLESIIQKIHNLLLSHENFHKLTSGSVPNKDDFLNICRENLNLSAEEKKCLNDDSTGTILYDRFYEAIIYRLRDGHILTQLKNSLYIRSAEIAKNEATRQSAYNRLLAEMKQKEAIREAIFNKRMQELAEIDTGKREALLHEVSKLQEQLAVHTDEIIKLQKQLAVLKDEVGTLREQLAKLKNENIVLTKKLELSNNMHNSSIVKSRPVADIKAANLEAKTTNGLAAGSTESLLSRIAGDLREEQKNYDGKGTDKRPSTLVIGRKKS